MNFGASLMIRVLLSAPLCLHIRLSSRFTCWPEMWIVPLIDRLFDADEDALIVVCGDFNADLDEVPVEAIRGDVENTGNDKLAKRVIVPCERTIPEPSRFSLLHHGKGAMLDHLLISRSLLAHYRGSEIHNE